MLQPGNPDTEEEPATEDHAPGFHDMQRPEQQLHAVGRQTGGRRERGVTV